jgi:hypothetical protein
MAALPSLLIVHQGALGDLVCIFPILAVLRRHYHPLAILCQGHWGKLAAAEQLVDVWFPIEAAWTASLFTGSPGPAARHALAPFTHIILFSSSRILRSSLQQISGARFACVPTRPPAGRRLHVTAHAVGGIRDHGWLPESAAAALLKMPFDWMSTPQPVDRSGSKTILLHPGAGSPRKRWPLAGFLEVAARILARGLNPEFVIGPAEHDLLPKLEQRATAVHRPADCLDLLDLFRSARAYVGNDSGASHLAAWKNLPSVVIFGPTDPARWQPRGQAVEIVQPPLKCNHCFETAGANCAGEECLLETGPDRVVEALERVTQHFHTAVVPNRRRPACAESDKNRPGAPGPFSC